jgi:hypothetical protein
VGLNWAEKSRLLPRGEENSRGRCAEYPVFGCGFGWGRRAIHLKWRVIFLPLAAREPLAVFWGGFCAFGYHCGQV